jgi:hypothetical protein
VALKRILVVKIQELCRRMVEDEGCGVDERVCLMYNPVYRYRVKGLERRMDKYGRRG